MKNKNYITGSNERILCNFLTGYHNPGVDAFMDLNTGKYMHLHRFADNNLAKIKSIEFLFDDPQAVTQAWLHLLCDYELFPKPTFELIRKLNKMNKPKRGNKKL